MNLHRAARALVCVLGVAPALPAQAADGGDRLIDLPARTALKDAGLDVSLSYLSEDLGNTRGGERRGFSHAGQASLSLDWDLERAFGWDGGRVFFALTQRDGEALDDHSGLGTLFWTHASAGRGNVTRLTTLWFERSFAADQLTVRLGRLNPGHDFENVSCNFLNLALCGNQSGSTGTSYWFNHPISQWGMTVRYNPTPDMYVKAGVYQVNPAYVETRNRVALDPDGTTGSLTPVEFGWTPTLADGRTGTYLAGAWYTNSPLRDIRTDVLGGNAGVSGLPSAQRTGAYGMYLSVEQELTRGGSDPANGLALFAKWVYSDRRTSLIDGSLGAGLVQRGIGRRTQDEMGFGVAVSRLNPRAAEARAALHVRGLSRAAGGNDEYLVEAFYGARLTPWLTFNPGLQWIRHPGGDPALDDVVILQARTIITF